jgi:hypothetical protein
VSELSSELSELVFSLVLSELFSVFVFSVLFELVSSESCSVSELSSELSGLLLELLVDTDNKDSSFSILVFKSFISFLFLLILLELPLT